MSQEPWTKTKYIWEIDFDHLNDHNIAVPKSTNLLLVKAIERSWNKTFSYHKKVENELYWFQQASAGGSRLRLMEWDGILKSSSIFSSCIPNIGYSWGCLIQMLVMFDVPHCVLCFFTYQLSICLGYIFLAEVAKFYVGGSRYVALLQAGLVQSITVQWGKGLFLILLC